MSPTKVDDKLLVWGAEGIEENTLDQARLTAKLPFVHSHVALMPDAHVGIGATVGSVIATEGAIVPAAVGVDIGCGMIATRTDLTAADLPDNLDALHHAIARAIPSGVGRGHDRSEQATDTIARQSWFPRDTQPAMVQNSEKLWRKTVDQSGSLGSGNHFVEVCIDEHDNVWVVLHSGSRGVGNEIAKRHIEGAKKIMKRYFIALDDPDLAYFAQGTPEFDAYIHDMLWAQGYARSNREQMMDAALTALDETIGRPYERVEQIDCFAGDTRVLTPGGARPIRELVGVAELLTTGGRWVKAPVRQFGRQTVMRLRLSRSGVAKVIYATPGHSWLIRSRRGLVSETTTAKLRVGDRLAFAFPEVPDDGAIDHESIARGFVLR